MLGLATSGTEVYKKPSVEDRTTHGPLRPTRARTELCIVHAFGDSKKVTGTTPAETERFFLRDPEGVATVTMSGSWKQKLAAFSTWWVWDNIPEAWSRDLYGHRYPKPEHRWDIPTRIPEAYQEAAHVPYHLECYSGGIVQWQPLEARTGHARGSNHTGLAVLVHWNRKGPPSEALLDRLREATQHVAWEMPGLEYIGHDESNKRNNLDTKGCPGFPIARHVPPWESPQPGA